MGVDPSGTVTFFSAGAEQMLGYSAAEVVGIRSIAYFIDPAQIDERRQTIDSLRRNAFQPADPEAVAEVPWTATRKDGQKRRCVVRVRAMPTPVVDDSLGVNRSAGPTPLVPVRSAVAGTTPSPTTGQRVASRCSPPPATWSSPSTSPNRGVGSRTRADLRRPTARSPSPSSNKTAACRELTQMKDDVVATVSHELRTPITSIRGFVELLLDDAPQLSEDQVKMLRTIDRSSAHLQRVAEDLLSDPGGGHGFSVAFTALDLRELAADAVD